MTKCSGSGKQVDTMLLLLTCAAVLSSVSATKFTVGDAKAWNSNVNYTQWVKKHEPFYKGDRLVFYYTNGMDLRCRFGHDGY